MKRFWALLMTLAAATAGAENWTLDAVSSELSFISLKNVDIAEAHRFGKLSGNIAADGALTVDIGLDSVDTKIPIRDERIREHVFGTSEFPKARISGQVNWQEINNMAAGESLNTEVRIELDFRGTKTPFLAQIQVSVIDDQILQAVSASPILVSARALGVAEGIEKLREIAALQSISMAVPVYFSLRFDRTP